jgi:hypothetical protein
MQMDPHCYNTDIFILLTATSKPTAINEKVLLRFHSNNDYANEPQYNVVRTLSIFWNTTELNVQRVNILNICFKLWLVEYSTVQYSTILMLWMLMFISVPTSQKTHFFSTTTNIQLMPFRCLFWELNETYKYTMWAIRTVSYGWSGRYIKLE